MATSAHIIQSETTDDHQNDAPTRGDATDQRTPQSCGRYVIVERVGVGGMGAVYSAYDPELDRKVALKLIRVPATKAHDQTTAATSQDLHNQLVREAKSMARIAHPNVVPIFDVGSVGTQIYLAMELIEGQTLDQLPPARDWREAVDRLYGAGLGLAAIHRAGMVHRDFKPPNLLVEADGTPRITDFGLAQASSRKSDDAQPAHALAAHNSSSVTPRGDGHDSMAGRVAGTPPYMAPEQHRGDAPTAATDQFAYCVTLFEQVFATRPFPARKIEALSRAKHAGEIEFGGRRSQAPRWLVELLRRGMDPQPERRYPDMKALLRALDDGRRLKRRRWTTALQISCALTLASVGINAVAQGPSKCLQGSDRVDTIWSADQRAQLAAAFTATDLSYAGESARRVTDILDDRSERWRDSHAQLCNMTATQPALIASGDFDRGQQCLNERQIEIRTLLERLSSADATVVEKANAAARALGRPSDCLEFDRLREAHPMPREPELRRAVLRGRERLIAARTALQTGRFTDALAIIESIDAQAQMHPPLAVERLSIQGAANMALWDYDAASIALSAAADLATRTGDHASALASTSSLLFVESYRQKDPAHLQTLIGLARAQLERAESPPGLARLFYNAIANVHLTNGRIDEAAEYYRESVELSIADEGPTNPQLITELANLSLVHHLRGNYAASESAARKALAISEMHEGPDHPANCPALDNLSRALSGQGKPLQALQALDRSLRLRESLGDAGRAAAIPTMHYRAALLSELSRPADAITQLEQFLAGFYASLGREHPRLPNVYLELAINHARLGHHDVSRKWHERAEALAARLSDRALGDFGAHHNLARLAVARGEWSHALELLAQAPESHELPRDVEWLRATLRARALRGAGSHTRAHALLSKLIAQQSDLPDTHFGRVAVLLERARTAVDLQRYSEARSDYRRALKIAATALPQDHSFTAEPLHELARVQQRLGRLAAARESVAKAVERFDADQSPRQTSVELERLAQRLDASTR